MIEADDYDLADGQWLLGHKNHYHRGWFPTQGARVTFEECIYNGRQQAKRIRAEAGSGAAQAAAAPQATGLARRDRRGRFGGLTRSSGTAYRPGQGLTRRQNPSGGAPPPTSSAPASVVSQTRHTHPQIPPTPEEVDDTPAPDTSSVAEFPSLAAVASP